MRLDLGEPAGACAHLWEELAVDAMTNDFWEVVLWSFWFFIWIAALMVWFRCLWDLFSDRSLSGWAKAAWAVLLIFVPWLGALIYLIARGRSMNERRRTQFEEQQAEQKKYIQEVAGGSKSPADEIASAKQLLDSGTITQDEYESIKTKALA
jgi:phospholipase D-like protein/putative oligomerization/nucleic acid binding protein